MPHQQHTDPPQLPQIQTQLSEATALRLLSRVTVSSAAPQLQQQQEPAPQTQQPPDTEVQLQTDTGTQLHPPETQSPEIQLLPETPQQPPTTTQTQPETDNDICCTSAAGCGTSTCIEPTSGTSKQLGVVLPEPGQGTHSSQDSVHSANEFGNSCRICRYNSSDMEIINCPCKCKGSVGYIHMKCLKRWIMHRRDNRCEICHSQFNITADRASVKQMVRAFCCGRCCGMIMKHVLFSASLMPLAHVILQQVLHCMDNLNQGNTDQLTVQEVFVASCALLTSSALFFHFFEFVTTRFLLIRNILRHWWMFGSTNDFGLVEVEDDAFDLF